ncbi:DMT family transporter [Phaeovulum sp. W22_SRMD_FR3]|uniref:DMT family transporter n=1 Tax=Phaeovulum sp. W22_SRMD_FR3 TaxID=3240274 RepID=UPI003F9575E8
MDNLRASLLMIAAMAGFAVEDMFVKALAKTLPVGEILALLGGCGAVVFATGAAFRRERIWSRDLLAPTVVLRNLGELIGTMGFVLAVALTPLAEASAILQALPLVVTLGAALFLGETVGWRRWTAITVGFLGVLVVIRPGLSGFNPLSILAVMGVIGLGIRDVVTRRVPKRISSWQLSTSAFAILVPAGLILMVMMGDSARMPSPLQFAALLGAIICGVLGYLALIAAMRMGDTSAVTPFRYTRLLCAIVIGWAVFGEVPDLTTLLGGAIIVASGLYTLIREARLKRRSA